MALLGFRNYLYIQIRFNYIFLFNNGEKKLCNHWLKKLNSYFRIPCKSSSDTADFWTQPETLCHKRAPAQDVNKFEKFIHYVKSVQIRSFFWSVFSRIQSECRKIWTKKNSVIWTLFTQFLYLLIFSIFCINWKKTTEKLFLTQNLTLPGIPLVYLRLV